MRLPVKGVCLLAVAQTRSVPFAGVVPANGVANELRVEHSERGTDLRLVHEHRAPLE